MDRNNRCLLFVSVLVMDQYSYNLDKAILKLTLDKVNVPHKTRSIRKQTEGRHFCPLRLFFKLMSNSAFVCQNRHKFAREGRFS